MKDHMEYNPGKISFLEYTGIRIELHCDGCFHYAYYGSKFIIVSSLLNSATTKSNTFWKIIVVRLIRVELYTCKVVFGEKIFNLPVFCVC